MPVPVPRQRAIPAVEGGQARAASSTGGPAQAVPAPGALPGQAPTSTSHDAGGDTGHGSADHGGFHHGSAHNGTAPLTLLVIEDDPAGSLNVPTLLDSAGKPIRVRTARNLTEAERLLTDDVQCILLDLALTTGGRTAADAEPNDELATLKHVLRLAPRHAVLALTASEDAEHGAEVVRVGAQDYLFRDELDSRLLSRAIRYAVERKRSETAERRLTESKLRAQENARLERGLLPTPLLEGSSLRFAARYRPGRSRALLGGDFYDTVRTPDGTVHAMIGDVCGHGPDEAALGVELRIAWRALTLAGLCGDELLSTLQQVLEHERDNDEIFATLCTVDIAPDGRRAGLCLAGHPAPLISRPARSRAVVGADGAGDPAPPVAELLPYENGGPALGLLPNARWPRRQVELGGEWSLMLYTDGLIEGRTGEGRERLGQDGMVDMVRRQLAQGLRGEELLRAAVNEVRDLNGGELTDDVAVLLLDRVA
ncbi:PP2C family protein-serine/threonine phosphatase [Streptomyces sp. IB201691-2A2]|jgi:serine phosphatase RsbU (regulator of sigma subunit)|uniref:PP2C family protein-serine/threonine phosphatase n=1 Tax=Streptomyces sp. IB201691-2A2 TaxID=2561920 RepID=UPI00117C6416|nr:fused response regulator/phosphatase [Streptomyces sp. IB201691-2A2]TRO62147.1 response regulator [Streptomyces sp. IB201691-2A2]